MSWICLAWVLGLNRTRQAARPIIRPPCSSYSSPEEKVFPQLVNLRGDPFEESLGAIAYKEWMFERVFVLVPAQDLVGNFLSTFQEYPPRQKPGSFGLERVMEQIMNAKQN